MADNKVSDKPNFFVRAGRGIGQWFRSLRSEMKKVVWPTSKQTFNNTCVVFATIIIVGAIISLFSLASTQAISFLINLKG